MGNNETKELIAFYNVENLFPPDAPQIHRLDPTNSGLQNWDERKYQNKLHKIAQVFNLIQESEGFLPMIIGLSEIYGQQSLDELIKMPPFNSNYGVIHFDSMDERGVDVALLYDQSKIEIISSEPIVYFFEFEETDPGKYDTTRDVLYCKVKYLGEILHVFVLHLPSKREKDINKPKRNYILNELHERTMNLLEKTNEAILICGDFNENPDEENLDIMLYDENFNNIFVNPYRELFKNNVFSTYHYKNGLLFDQMILSNSFFQSHSLLQFKNAKVFNHGKLMNTEEGFKGRPFRTYAGTRYLGGYSDHFPIFIELQINEH
jgi:exonuclease III